MHDTLQLITDLLEVVFAPLLAIELVWLWRRGLLDRARIKEMLANVSSLLFVIPAGALGVYLWARLFDAISAVHSPGPFRPTSARRFWRCCSPT